MAVWWKPHSAAGLEAELAALRRTLAATEVLVYCGYAALPDGSFGVSPNASRNTWGTVSLCPAAVRLATAAGLRSRIMVDGRVTLGFEAAVRRGGARFGAEMAAAVPGGLVGGGNEGGGGEGGGGAGLVGFSFDFEHRAGTHGAVDVSVGAHADFLRGVGGALPAGLDLTVAAATGWPFMSNFSRLLSPGPTGGNASALLDMALCKGTSIVRSPAAAAQPRSSVPFANTVALPTPQVPRHGHHCPHM